jgi:hypothetical protein
MRLDVNLAERWAQRLSAFMAKHPPFDPATLGDPLATQTQWTPTKGGGTNFRTHKLVRITADRLAFRPTAGMLIFCALFMFIGYGVAGGVSALQIREGTFALKAETLVPLLLGAVFAAIGTGMLRASTKPIVFDRRKGYFWKGRQAPDEVLNPETLKHIARIEDVHALQLVSEYCRGNKSSYYSYELNLVHKDATRTNVVDHGNVRKLREDAATLAQFLNKPVWDATSG